MIKTVIIDSIDGVMKLIGEQGRDDRIGRTRSTYYYRGMTDAAYELTTSLRLNCKQLSAELEPSILQAFSNYMSNDDPAIKDSVWKQMMIGQHHGLPTRLMDWTYSPLIALHFADNAQNLSKLDARDCVVWRIDIRECNANLPERYKAVLARTGKSVFTSDTLVEVAKSVREYDRDMNGQAFVLVEPPSIDQRIVNQYSFFSVIPSGMEDVGEFLDKNTDSTVRFIIKKEIRWDLRDLLDQCNVSERILYPGLDGLSRTLARHYYVK